MVVWLVGCLFDWLLVRFSYTQLLSVVGTVSRLGDGRSVVRIPGQADIYLLQNNQDRLWGPPSPLFCENRGSFPEVKQTGQDVDHSPHLAHQLTMSEAAPLLPPYTFMARTGTTSRLLLQLPLHYLAAKNIQRSKCLYTIQTNFSAELEIF